jgi:uncharacterized protein (TIGR00106 family)
MALMQLTIIPLGTETPSVGEYVADIQQALEEANVHFQLNDMGTLIEGEAQELLRLVARLYELPFQRGARRVVTQIVMDDRRDKHVGIGDKIDAVQKRMKAQKVAES